MQNNINVFNYVKHFKYILMLITILFLDKLKNVDFFFEKWNFCKIFYKILYYLRYYFILI